MDFLGNNVQVLVGIQFTRNYRFDCEFVLKYFSNDRFFVFLKFFCDIFENRAPHGSINSLQNRLAVPPNRLRVHRLGLKIVRFCFLEQRLS